MWNRMELKARGKGAFFSNYLPCVAVAFLMGFISMIFSGGNGRSAAVHEAEHIVSSPSIQEGVMEFAMSQKEMLFAGLFSMFVIIMFFVVLLLTIFVEYALVVGGKQFFIQNQTSNPGVGIILNIFKCGHYGNVIITMFLKDLFVVLWSFLLVIPGIVKYYEYLMVPYILAENPGMDRREVFQISKEMMDGHKWDAFVLDLSFIGWNILSVFTFGLLTIFFIKPYIEATYAEVYRFNKQLAYERGYIR